MIYFYWSYISFRNHDIVITGCGLRFIYGNITNPRYNLEPFLFLCKPVYMFLGLYFFSIEPVWLANIGLKNKLIWVRKLSTTCTGKMKGCVVMNQNTCITIDVSQNKSHIQGFIGPNKPLSKARTMRNTKQGFQFILILKNLIESKTNETPLIVFEFTGIYHNLLKNSLYHKTLSIILLLH